MKDDSRMKRILVVDDEDDVRLFLQDFLVERNLTVDAADNGKRALEMMQKQQYDIVLLDVMMPEMDGMSCLEKIKSLYPKTKVIMITALKDEERIQRATKLGATQYIIKPFSLGYLESELMKMIDHA
ncbi:MAG: hypothetical protein A2Z83_02035 [Omnitrophica bacterium GWA2_52_8]|nr:MAG: hypothetical protein A2Z83_02035 [Omnitrophica bacterium GWA2_52_8]